MRSARVSIAQVPGWEGHETDHSSCDSQPASSACGLPGRLGTWIEPARARPQDGQRSGDWTSIHRSRKSPQLSHSRSGLLTTLTLYLSHFVQVNTLSDSTAKLATEMHANQLVFFRFLVSRSRTPSRAPSLVATERCGLQPPVPKKISC